MIRSFYSTSPSVSSCEKRTRTRNAAGASVGAAQQIAEPADVVGVVSSADGRFVLDGVVRSMGADSGIDAPRSEPLIVTVGDGGLDGIRLVVDKHWHTLVNNRTHLMRVNFTSSAPSEYQSAPSDLISIVGGWNL